MTIPKPVIVHDIKVDKDSGGRALVYGPGGSGKTTLASTFPKPMCILDFDDKLKSIRGVPGIVAYPFHLTGQMKDAHLEFLNFIDTWNALRKGELLSPEGEPFKTVVFDSLTSFDRLCLIYHFIMAGKNPDIHRGKNGEWETDKFSQNIYGDQAGFYKMLLAQFIGIQGWFIVNAHEHRRENSQEETHIQPLMSGKKIPDELPSMFEEVWYLKKNRKGIPMLEYYPKGLNIANSTMIGGGHSGEIENPTFDKIMAEAEKKPLDSNEPLPEREVVV
jgi:hypothetical protein